MHTKKVMISMELASAPFVAYKGNDLQEIDIRKAICNVILEDDYDDVDLYRGVNLVTDRDVIFAKYNDNIALPSYEPNRLINGCDKIIAVSSYLVKELDTVYCLYSDDDDFHYRYSDIIPKMYSCHGKDMYQILSKHMHFCSVIWDKANNTLIGGVTKPANSYMHLYYGYTKRSHEILYSNNRKIVNILCDKAKEVPNNTIMLNDEKYAIKEEKLEKIVNLNKEENIMLKTDVQEAQFLLEAVNTLVNGMVDEITREKVNQNLDDYLASDDPKKRIEDYIIKQLDDNTKLELLKLIKTTIEEYKVRNNVHDQIYDFINQTLDEFHKKQLLPLTRVMTLNDVIVGQTSPGFYHEKFEEVLKQVQLDEPVMLIGPAGSGKNVAIKQVADALGLKMYYTNNASNEFKLTGFIDAGGNYRDTEFYKAFKNGGVFFLDEIDNSDPSALIVINAALANGYMAFPHETIERHPDFRMIAAANTWGKGSDLQYVGRTALDASTLDRFDNIFFDYDRKLEQSLFPNDEVLSFMWSFRDAVEMTKIPHVVSTRGIGKVYKKDLNHFPVNNILTSNVVKNLGQDDVNTIIGRMKNIASDNKYYKGIKELRLTR